MGTATKTPHCSPAHHHKSSTTQPPPQPSHLQAHQSIHPPIHHTIKPSTPVSPKSERPGIRMITPFDLVKQIYIFFRGNLSQGKFLVEPVLMYLQALFMLIFYSFCFVFLFVFFSHQPSLIFFLVVCHPRGIPWRLFIC